MSRSCILPIIKEAVLSILIMCALTTIFSTNFIGPLMFIALIIYFICQYYYYYCYCYCNSFCTWLQLYFLVDLSIKRKSLYFVKICHSSVKMVSFFYTKYKLLLLTNGKYWSLYKSKKYAIYFYFHFCTSVTALDKLWTTLFIVLVCAVFEDIYIYQSLTYALFLLSVMLWQFFSWKSQFCKLCVRLKRQSYQTHVYIVIIVRLLMVGHKY